MPLTRPTGIGLRVQGHNPHLAHQVLYLLAVHRETLIVQPVTNSATAVEGTLEMHLIDPPHQPQILIRDTRRLVIHRGAIEIQQLTLAGHRQ
jgi:hypothetical protein